MLKHILTATLLITTPAIVQGQNFEEGSEAKPWNLYAEYPARFEATVVDMLCEVAGQCTDNCGDGRRQLGLLRTADNVLVYPNKNSQAAFTGAAVELLPYCGQEVEVDGLELVDEDLGAVNIYLVQKIRLVGEEEWVKANNWTKNWAEEHPEAAGKGPWFRRDPRVLAEIEEEGYFGLGIEEDEALKDVVFPE
jgi:hypothetical protein